MNKESIPNAFAELLIEMINESDLSQIDISTALGIPSPHLSEMKKGRRNCTAEYDLRLSRYFGTSDGYWLRLQTAYQMRIARAKKGKLIVQEVQAAS